MACFKKCKVQGGDGLRDKNGVMLQTETAKLDRLREHFQQLFTIESAVSAQCSPEVYVPTAPSGTAGDRTPTEQEVLSALKRLKNRKAPGCCRIPAELLKYGGGAIAKWLTRVIRLVWDRGKAPQEWKDILVTAIPKKGDPSYCDNLRGISLLSIPGKVYA